MKVIYRFLILVLVFFQFAVAEPVGKPQSLKNDTQNNEETSDGKGKIIAGVVLVGSLLALAANKSSEPEGQDHNNNELFAGIAVAAGIGLYVSSKKDKEVNLTLSENDTPLLAFRYKF